MRASGESITVAVVLFAAMAAYALLSGADLGAGIWDALAGGQKRGAAPRAAIRTSITAVWEANNVWIIFGLVLFWTGFPVAFAATMTALFVPLALSLLGIVLRGTGFVFRQEADRLPTKMLTTALFAGSSTIAPFFLGTAVGAVATGGVRPGATGNDPTAWTAAVPLVTGALFVATCAFIGAVYLVADCRRRDNEPIARYFARRALAAGALSGGLAAANLALMHAQAPYVFHRLLHTAYPLVLTSAIAGATALGMIAAGHTRLIRPVAGVAVATVVAAWGWAQYPYLLPRSLSLAAGSAPSSALRADLIVAAVAAVLVAPAFGYLFWLQQHAELRADNASSQQLRKAVAKENAATRPHPAPSDTAPQSSHRLLATVLIGAAVLNLIRDAAAGIARRRSRDRAQRRS